MKADDQVFPCAELDEEAADVPASAGITARDWIAAQCLPAIILTQKDHLDPTRAPIMAYEFADEMIRLSETSQEEE